MNLMLIKVMDKIFVHINTDWLIDLLIDWLDRVLRRNDNIPAMQRPTSIPNKINQKRNLITVRRNKYKKRYLSRSEV